MAIFSWQYIRRLALAGLSCLVTTQSMSTAHAVEGTELNSTKAIWAPLLPGFQGASGDGIGVLTDVRGHHRFDGYLTSIEGNFTYAITENIEMYGFDAIIRDTWTLGAHDLSAGTGYSQMEWKHEVLDNELDSSYRGAAVVLGWETAFGRRPLWVDLKIGLYDLDTQFVSADGGTVAANNKFTTTWGIDVKHDVTVFGVPGRTVFGVDYLSDIAEYDGTTLGFGDGVVLTAGIELLLF